MFLDACEPFPSMGNNRGMMACLGFTLVGLVPNINEDDVGHIKLWFGLLSQAAVSSSR
jgi:hypothetical protein